MVGDQHAGRIGSGGIITGKRDHVVLWLLERHPATAAMLAEIGLFPNRKKASKRLRRLAQQGQVRRLGTVSLKNGRPEHVYARGRWKTDNLLHEVLLTRVCLKIHADEVRRGPGEIDAHLRPDAELVIGSQRYCLELDCGTISYPDIVRKRFSKYQTSKLLVFWVCPSEARKEGLRLRAEMIREVALFTTLDQALVDPHAAIWMDADGARAALPRAAPSGAKVDYSPRDNDGDKPAPLSPPASGQATTTPDNQRPATQGPAPALRNDS